MADPALRLGKEALEGMSTLDDEGVVALLDGLVYRREQRALHFLHQTK